MRRSEKRAAARRLGKTKVYTLKATGEALEAMSNCLLIRPDGVIVSLAWHFDADGGDVVRPAFQVRDRATGGLWVRIARWLLGLR